MIVFFWLQKKNYFREQVAPFRNISGASVGGNASNFLYNLIYVCYLLYCFILRVQVQKHRHIAQWLIHAYFSLIVFGLLVLYSKLDSLSS